MEIESFKKISDKVKKEINSIEIVTPSIYNSIYNNIASDLNIDIKSEQDVSNNLITNQISMITKLNNQTNQNIEKLDCTSKKALDALHKRDENLLQETINETALLRQEIENLKNSLYQDTLTKAYNRSWLNNKVIFNENNFDTDGVLVIIDMNYFKEINDTLGHSAGDKALVYITNFIKKSCKCDVVRYGGDEFILIYKYELDFEKIDNNLNNFRENLLKKQLKFKEKKFRLSFSFGTVLYKKGDSFFDILEKADEKMYEDKIYIKKKVTSI
jgi:diguanylate cyclase (GGDEF)-like protein